MWPMINMEEHSFDCFDEDEVGCSLIWYFISRAAAFCGMKITWIVKKLLSLEGLPLACYL